MKVKSDLKHRPKAVITIRVPEPVKQTLEAHAEASHRTLSQEVRRLIELHLEAA